MVNNNQCPEIVDEILQELVDEGIWLMMIREPTNNIASNCLVKVRAFKHDDDTISVSEPVLAGLNADFDGGVTLKLYFDVIDITCNYMM